MAPVVETARTWHTDLSDWQWVHELPDHTILVTPEGHAYQVIRYKNFPSEVWLCPISDEYAFIIRQGSHSDYYEPSPMKEVWRPEQ